MGDDALDTAESVRSDLGAAFVGMDRLREQLPSGEVSDMVERNRMLNRADEAIKTAMRQLDGVIEDLDDD